MKKRCWLAKQCKKGWRLGLAEEKKTFWLPKWFKTHVEIQHISETNNCGIVFIHLSAAKQQPKEEI